MSRLGSVDVLRQPAEALAVALPLQYRTHEQLQGAARQVTARDLHLPVKGHGSAEGQVRSGDSRSHGKEAIDGYNTERICREDRWRHKYL